MVSSFKFNEKGQREVVRGGCEDIKSFQPVDRAKKPVLAQRVAESVKSFFNFICHLCMEVYEGIKEFFADEGEAAFLRVRASIEATTPHLLKNSNQ